MPMSQGASHLERSDLKLFEDRGFRVLRVHDVTSSIVDTSCNNLPRYSTRRYVFLPDDIELRWRELCQRTSRPLHKIHSPPSLKDFPKTLSLESGCTHTRPSVRGDSQACGLFPVRQAESWNVIRLKVLCPSLVKEVERSVQDSYEQNRVHSRFQLSPPLAGVPSPKVEQVA